MDAALLRAVLPELHAEFEGRPITKVELAGKFGLLIRFGGTRRLLWLSAHPELSRLGLVDRPIDGAEPRPAPDNLAEPLVRARWVGAEREPAGRVATLRFQHPEARHKAPRLVAELIPRFANVILVGNDDRILWAEREFRGERSRRIVPGRTYEEPAAESGVPLARLNEATLRERIDAGEGPLHRRIPRGWGGGAAGFARLLETSAGDVDDFVRRVLRLAAAEPDPRLARDDTGGQPPVLFPADPGPLPGWTIEGAASASALADAYYRPREEGEAADTLLADLRRVLVKRRNRAAKALRQIERRLEDADREGELRQRAELLAAHVGELKRGMKSARLPAFDGSGDVEIVLDPRLDPSANVEALFKKARRIARGRVELESQQSIQAEELALADGALARLEDADPDELVEVAREHAPSLLERRPGAATAAARAPSRTPEPKRGSAPEGFQPRIYFLPGDWEVWVGRNARQNDELTHHRASQKDLWFHARGCQGSHTVLRISSGKGEPPRAIIEAAASIAAFHSKARNSQLVPVAYTEKRYVRRPRGAKAGTAVMMREKVLMVEPRLPEGAED